MSWRREPEWLDRPKVNAQLLSNGMADSSNIFDLLLQVLGSGAADSWTVRHWRDIGESSRVYPGGADGVAALTHKDLALALAAAQHAGIDVPVTELAARA